MTSQTKTVADRLAREELIDMVPYESARRLFSSSDTAALGDAIWLNANEAPGSGAYQLDSFSVNRYPDFQPTSLLTAYSDYCGQPLENVLATRGADEGIELLIRTFCKAYQDSILICPPTYGMYAISAENHGAGIVKVPLIEKTDDQGATKKNQLNLAALAEQVGKVKIVFLCSPGNPTGNLLPHCDIKAVIELFKDTAIVVVDEAYIEFSPEQSVMSWLSTGSDEPPTYGNLVVLRTLSKAFALAGLRCGFTMANSDIITMLSKVIAPYPISAPVAEIASQALNNDGLTVMTERVASSNNLRVQLAQWLAEQPWCEFVHPSDANFVLFKTTKKDFIFQALLAKNILIRDQSKQVQLENCLRISIGSEQELTLLKQTINAAINGE
jgi:histidinol-phosphate aminotransferase